MAITSSNLRLWQNTFGLEVQASKSALLPRCVLRAGLFFEPTHQSVAVFVRGERSSSKPCVLRVLPYCQVSWLNFAQSQTICLLIYIC